jgi:hypothetical protein
MTGSSSGCGEHGEPGSQEPNAGSRLLQASLHDDTESFPLPQSHLFNSQTTLSTRLARVIVASAALGGVYSLQSLRVVVTMPIAHGGVCIPYQQVRRLCTPWEAGFRDMGRFHLSCTALGPLQHEGV